MAMPSAKREAGPAIQSYRWPQWVRDLRGDWPFLLILIIALALSLIPTYFNIIVSFKSMGQFFTDPVGLSLPLHFLENYRVAFAVLWPTFLVSIGVAIATIAGTLTVSSLAAYAFARFQFPFRERLYWMVIIVLFIPGVLTFMTRYILVAEYGMLNTIWVLIIPRIATQQTFQIFILRAFFSALHEEILEAARWMAPASGKVLWHVVLPMSRPILAVLGIIELLDVWQDWLWPLITITNTPELRPMALQVLFLASDVGPHYGYQMAGYVLASVPMIVIFFLFSRQFIEGLSSGALKW